MSELESSLALLPEDLSEALENAFVEIRTNFVVQRWEPSELNGGKLAEIVFRVLEWESTGRGTYTPLGQHIRNFGASVRRFENDTSLPESIRFHLPRALDFLYTLRNKRGVGHAAGDISPNHMDAAGVVSVSKWVVAELVRLLHGVEAVDARRAVEEVTAKDVELVWAVGDTRRVLDPDLGYKEKTLLLLHREHPRTVSGRQLFEWVEYSSWSSYRKNILLKCHAARLIEYTSGSDKTILSPRGIQVAEDLILNG